MTLDAARSPAAPVGAPAAPRPQAPAAPGHRAVTPRPHPSGRPGRWLAIAFAVAWVLCPAVEPIPADDAAYPLWQLVIDLSALGTIVLAVTLLWRSSRHAPAAGIAAGVLMAVETITCPWAGHTPVGWWTWVQAVLSLAVLLTSTALVSRWPRLTAGR